ncbi:MAG TPA: PD-(D/E)XK nuclease family protein, partial [Candidatus Limnocylindria bacterium]|nr:PD-(D/E)XK nuclease family protein [Candidatus Limnocylindria bacterium]
ELARNRLVDPLLRLAIDTGDMPNGTVMAGALAALLAAWKVESQLDSWYLANPDAPHNTVWKALVSWAENIKLAFAQDRLSLADWAEIFESGLLGLSVGVLPAALDQVLLGPVDRSRNPELKIVFVPGLNDGVFPARPPAPQILGQHETLWLELKGLGRSGVSLGRMAHERFFAYIALTRSSRQVIASWSSAGAGGEALEASAVVRQLRQIFPNSIIRGPGRRGIAEFRHPAQWLFAGIAPPPSTAAGIEISRLPLFTRATDAGWHAPLPEDRLRPTVTLLRGQPALRFSPSQLESFANCPFQYFAQDGLGCKERPLFEADSRDQGSFEHAILATFHRLVMQRGERWRDLSPPEIHRLISEAVASELQREDRDAFSRTPASLYRTRAVQDRLAGLVTRLIAGMASHAFDPVDVEVPLMISSPPDSNTSPTQPQIQGRLDRIDRAVDPVTGREYLLVSDYKSRARTFDHEKFHAGTDIQTPLYAAATVEGLGRRHRGQPAGWVWVPLHTKLERGGSRTEFAETKNKPWLRGRLSYDALSLLQTHEAAESPFSLKLKKDGQPVATADLRSDTEFTGILQDAITIAHGLANMILQGRAEPAPLQFKGTIPCDYCRARDVCRFDMTVTQPRTAPLFALPQPLC